jgi:formylglycine-generating enzyme required for sulfatase activity
MVTSISAAQPPSGKALSVEYIVRKLDAWGVPRQLQPGKMAKSMIVVPAGEFIMGTDDSSTDTYPRRNVYVDEFQIDKHEVTVEEFRQFVREAGYDFQPSSMRDCNYGATGKEKHPMNCISWVDANAYAKWAGKSLPTEAEWEKAARGEGGLLYPWGNDRLDASDAAIDSDQTAPVGSHPKDRSAYGVMDMLGNVSEWIDDWYDKNYYRVAPLRNPSGPATGKDKVLRGGSFESQVDQASLVGRKRNIPGAGRFSAAFGFRCVVRGRK